MTVHLDSSLPPAAALPGSAATRPSSPLLPRETPAPVGAAPATTAPPAPTAGALVHISAQGRQSLGQAAAQLHNQNTLLQALGAPLQAGVPLPATRTTTPLPKAAPTPSTVPTSTEHSAAQAPALPAQHSPPLPTNAWIQSYAGHKQDLPTLPPAAPKMLLTSHSDATTTDPSTTGHPIGEKTIARPAAMHWPSHGVGKPLHTLVQTLVQQATALLGPQRVLAAQHWPAALVPVVDPQPPAKAEPDLAPLQTWLVHQGVVQTREGPRGVSITLRVPTPWLRAWEQAQATAQPSHTGNGWLGSPQPAPSAGTGTPRPLQAVFVGPSASLQSGTLALALESPGMAGMRTSALMLLEFQPLLRSSASAQASTLYGRHSAPHLRQDPWLHMATIQASGHVHHEEEDMVHPSAALCDTPGCPYQGETACVQPFCMALRGPAPVDALAGSSSTPSPHTPGLR
ncbi:MULTISPECIES: hypothetical protein [Giesbergeria]|uniref:Uncharacterized protein n=1 Tax=Giesbergeria sinuosa TaxID=80883 RepID=A0ABV9QDG6_9BURK